MKNSKVCYLGDGSIQGPAAYLAGIMTHYGIPFDRVDSDASPDSSFLQTQYAAYVLSDYPAQNLTLAHLAHIAESVQNGSGLVMFGGWESYYGRLGEYHNTVLADVLPVKMQTSDDRRNYAQPVLVCPAAGAENHPILTGLPWNTPPGVGGFNEFQPKSDATVLLEAVRFHVSRETSAFSFEKVAETPLLVVGHYGKGKTVALATDVAPHWVGGFVDWGKSRLVQDIPGADFIDVGADYALFFKQLLDFARLG